MTPYTLETLQEHIDDFKDGKIDVRTEDELANVTVMARSFQNMFKLKSPEQLLLAKFIKDVEAVRRKRFPKTVKPQLRVLSEDESDEIEEQQ